MSTWFDLDVRRPEGVVLPVTAPTRVVVRRCDGVADTVPSGQAALVGATLRQDVVAEYTDGVPLILGSSVELAIATDAAALVDGVLSWYHDRRYEVVILDGGGVPRWRGLVVPDGITYEYGPPAPGLDGSVGVLRMTATDGLSRLSGLPHPLGAQVATLYDHLLEALRAIWPSTYTPMTGDAGPSLGATDHLYWRSNDDGVWYRWLDAEVGFDKDATALEVVEGILRRVAGSLTLSHLTLPPAEWTAYLVRPVYDLAGANEVLSYIIRHQDLFGAVPIDAVVAGAVPTGWTSRLVRGVRRRRAMPVRRVVSTWDADEPIAGVRGPADYSFEAWDDASTPTYWTTSGNVGREGTIVHGGTYAARLDADGAWIEAVSGSSVPVGAGVQVTFWHRAQPGAAGQDYYVRLTISLEGDDGSTWYWDGTSWTSASAYVSYNRPADNTWRQETATTDPVPVSGALRLRLERDDAGRIINYVYLDEADYVLVDDPDADPVYRVRGQEEVTTEAAEDLEIRQVIVACERYVAIDDGPVTSAPRVSLPVGTADEGRPLAPPRWKVVGGPLDGAEGTLERLVVRQLASLLSGQGSDADRPELYEVGLGPWTRPMWPGDVLSIGGTDTGILATRGGRYVPLRIAMLDLITLQQRLTLLRIP